MWSNEEAHRRAVAALWRKHKREHWSDYVWQQPNNGGTYFTHEGGKLLLVLSNVNGTLAVFRVVENASGDIGLRYLRESL